MKLGDMEFYKDGLRLGYITMKLKCTSEMTICYAALTENSRLKPPLLY